MALHWRADRLSHNQSRYSCDHEVPKADEIIRENEIGGQDDEIEGNCEEHRRRQEFLKLFDYECEERRLRHEWTIFLAFYQGIRNASPDARCPRSISLVHLDHDRVAAQTPASALAAFLQRPTINPDGSVTIYMSGSESKPLLPYIAPPIQYNLTMTMTSEGDHGTMTMTNFPSFQVFVDGKDVFYSKEQGTPFNLFFQHTSSISVPSSGGCVQ
jgi:hypothetical protein